MNKSISKTAYIIKFIKKQIFKIIFIYLLLTISISTSFSAQTIEDLYPQPPNASVWMINEISYIYEYYIENQLYRIYTCTSIIDDIQAKIPLVAKVNSDGSLEIPDNHLTTKALVFNYLRKHVGDFTHKQNTFWEEKSNDFYGAWVELRDTDWLVDLSTSLVETGKVGIAISGSFIFPPGGAFTAAMAGLSSTMALADYTSTLSAHLINIPEYNMIAKAHQALLAVNYNGSQSYTEMMGLDNIFTEDQYNSFLARGYDLTMQIENFGETFETIGTAIDIASDAPDIFSVGLDLGRTTGEAAHFAYKVATNDTPTGISLHKWDTASLAHVGVLGVRLAAGHLAEEASDVTFLLENMFLSAQFHYYVLQQLCDKIAELQNELEDPSISNEDFFRKSIMAQYLTGLYNPVIYEHLESFIIYDDLIEEKNWVPFFDSDESRNELIALRDAWEDAVFNDIPEDFSTISQYYFYSMKYYEKYFYNNEPGYLDNPSILPSDPSIIDDIIFTIRYTDADGDVVDQESVKVVVDGIEKTLSANSNSSGTIFTSSGEKYSKGLHEYYFVAEQYGATLRYPTDSSSLTFIVSDANPNGLSLTASPGNLSVCTGDSSTLTAILLEDEAPIPNREVVFVILSGDGYLSSQSETTDSQGTATTIFTPDGTGTTQIGAIVSGLSMSQTSITTGGCSVNIIPNMYLKSCTDTSSTYKIEARITAEETGDAIQNEYATVKVQDLSGNYFGSLYDYDDNTGNPLSTKTDNYGDFDSFLLATTEQDILVTIEYDGTTKSFQNHVNAGCVPPADIQPFSRIDASPYDSHPNAISVSPDGNKLAVTNYRQIDIYDISAFKATGEWSVWHTLKQPEPDRNETLSVAWSPDGNYLAAGFRDPADADEPGLMVWYTGTTPDDYTVYMKSMASESYFDVFSIAWSPDSNYLMTGERLYDSAGVGGYARIWRLSTKSQTWVSPHQATDEINAVAWSELNYKAVGTDDGYIWIYNSSNSRIANFLSWDEGEEVQSLEWNPDGSILAVGTGNSGSHSPIQTYNSNGVQVGSFSEHTGPVFGLKWHETSGMASVGFSSTGGEYVKIWEDSGSEKLSFAAEPSSIDLEWLPDGNILYVLDDTGVSFYAPFDSEGPLVTISSPSNGAQLSNETVVVIGTISDLQIVSSATIQINDGTPVSISVESDHSFTFNVSLIEGDNTISVQATDGNGNTSSKTITVTRNIPEPDFILTTSTASQRISSGDSIQFDLNLVSVDGFDSPVSLSISGLPNHVTASFSTDEVTPSGTTQLTITSGLLAKTGYYNLTVSGTGEDKIHLLSLELIIEHTPVIGDYDKDEDIDIEDVIQILSILIGNNQSGMLDLTKTLSGEKVELVDVLYCLRVIAEIQDPLPVSATP